VISTKFVLLENCSVDFASLDEGVVPMTVTAIAGSCGAQALLAALEQRLRRADHAVVPLTANGDDLTDSTDPSRKMMRQIAGAFHEYEKARLVAKLKAARERKRAAAGKCEGRKSWAEINPDLVREAKRLRRRSPKGHQRSLRDVAAELAKLGFFNQRGAEFSASSALRAIQPRRYRIGGSSRLHLFNGRAMISQHNYIIDIA
jgi:hypothetical protein